MNNTKAMKTRFQVIKLGYAHEDGQITDNKVVMTDESMMACARWIDQHDPAWNDFFLEQAEKDGPDWLSIEGTQRINPIKQKA